MNKKNLDTVLGDRLRMARIRKGWSQTEVAKKIGLSFSSLSGYERNYRKPPTETLAHLAEMYEVSISWLLGIGESGYQTQDREEVVIKDPELDYWYKQLPNLSKKDLRKLRKVWELIKEENL
ncbi:helix-turn-helix domain-containing protein [Domibacillus epiphyticus]|uniref:HTH cro/C1-type domain-containing protein n=1 Tax=Domibacillus epiphyticus TaxID=1714355 RepID=A0A1V2ACR0_9BACI|nr:helix-turn-helix transcriptional regulator [Domibacillus epiphyticus]OMP68783.1 hypothetical protein BTO28_01185 [Domibacillus epiphyticus]